MFDRGHLYDLAERFTGIQEVAGKVDNPQIMSMLTLDMSWPTADEVPWCSAFVNYIAWLGRAPRSKDLRARSWLEVGRSVAPENAEPGDVIVLKRGTDDGPEVIDAPGHVGFFAGYSRPGFIEVLGGNQSNTVKVSAYPADRLLSVRRIA
jgi:uncharacterized protein (TIGR02594 family)